MQLLTWDELRSGLVYSAPDPVTSVSWLAAEAALPISAFVRVVLVRSAVVDWRPTDVCSTLHWAPVLVVVAAARLG